MTTLPPCPECQAGHTYEDRDFLVCATCGHEWSVTSDADERLKASDANGNTLLEGDSATLIKDLKVKGSSSVLKIGTKVKINRIVDGDHNIDCRVDKVGEMMLKSAFVKKSSN